MLSQESRPRKWPLWRSTSKEELPSMCSSCIRCVWRGTKWRTPSSSRSSVLCPMHPVHDPSPTVWPRRQGFLKCPTTALLVGTLQLAKTSLQDRYSFLETLDSQCVPSDTIWNKRSPSITLWVSLVGKTSSKQISARALLDSGAEGCYLQLDFALLLICVSVQCSKSCYLIRIA